MTNVDPKKLEIFFWTEFGAPKNWTETNGRLILPRSKIGRNNWSRLGGGKEGLQTIGRDRPPQTASKGRPLAAIAPSLPNKHMSCWFRTGPENVNGNARLVLCQTPYASGAMTGIPPATS